MKHFTSYYANYPKIPKSIYCIGISRFCPEWMKSDNFENFLWVKNNFLAPSESLLSDFKSNKITIDEYKYRYVTELFDSLHNLFHFNSLVDWLNNVDESFKSYDGVCFLCYEKPDEFCHRHLLRRIFTNFYNIDFQEYGVPEEKTWSPAPKPEQLF